MKAPLSPQGQLRRRGGRCNVQPCNTQRERETAKSVTRSPAARPNREVPLSAFLAHVCVRAVSCPDHAEAAAAKKVKVERGLKNLGERESEGKSPMRVGTRQPRMAPTRRQRLRLSLHCLWCEIRIKALDKRITWDLERPWISLEKLEARKPHIMFQGRSDGCSLS